ncbi:hypothetical protein [Pseudomonas borbori]|uniref:hypothetical protein n=1 Tax=Pseudomonas borbori TaxID=289003 RepID=UPI000B808AEE|nr:hypothetical protein [Pseudomonas borbori]
MIPATALSNPTGYLIGIGIKKIVETISDADSTTPISTLKEESLRAEIKAKALLAQAKVEQELAISRRIDSAEEVEIEEFYDTSGKGNAGLSTDGESISLGLGGEGRRVTKRIIKFKGCTPTIQPQTTDA